MTIDANGNELLGYAGILMGSERDELRPSRTGSLFLAYDLKRYKAEARAQVLQQSLYWAGWVTALALAMWLVFHFLLTRRTARLVQRGRAARRGQSRRAQRPQGTDELGRLSRAFDAMALAISDDIAERKRADEALRVSEASYRAIFDAAEDAIFVHDIETGAIVDVNRQGLRDVRLHARGVPHASTSARSAPASIPYTQQDAMALIARAVAGEQLRVEWHGRRKDGTPALARGVRQARDDRRPRSDAGARARHHRPQERPRRRCARARSSIARCSTRRSTAWRCGTPQGEIVDTNPALWRMYGYSDDELLGAAAGRWAGPSYRPEFLRSVAAGESLHSEVTEQRKDGSRWSSRCTASRCSTRASRTC